jgi:hypothetical protein
VFEYIGLTALAAYASLYHQHVAQTGGAADRTGVHANAGGLLNKPA